MTGSYLKDSFSLLSFFFFLCSRREDFLCSKTPGDNCRFEKAVVRKERKSWHEYKSVKRQTVAPHTARLS